MRNSGSTPRRPGRPATPSTARDDILGAARRRFARDGYAATSLRAVARSVGVDPALVRHYFTDKEHLFAAAMRLPFTPGDVASTVAAGDPAELGHRLATFFLTQWDAPEASEVMTGILGAALTHSGSANLLGEAVQRFVLGPISQLIGGEDAAFRAELAGSHLIGLAMARYAVKVEPLASKPREEIIEAIAPTLQRYLLPEAA